MTTTVAGRATGGKPINLSQLEGELETAGVLSAGAPGLGMYDNEMVHTYDAAGTPVDFSAAQQPAVDAAIAAHVAMRDVTDAEYAAEFQLPATTPERKQEIRDITDGLMPHEQVPLTQDEWDQSRKAPA